MIYENFDLLGFLFNYFGRVKIDIYYINFIILLWMYMLVYEVELFVVLKFLGYFILVDVYRRDEIDKFYYFVFYQMEGVWVWDCNMVLNGDIVVVVYRDLDVLLKYEMIIEDFNFFFYLECNFLQLFYIFEEVEVVGKYLK